MRICFISNLYPPYIIGGAEINVQREADGLALRGHRVSVITTSPSSRQSTMEIVGNVKVYRISPFNLYMPFESNEKPRIMKPLFHLVDIWNPHAFTLIKSILLKEKPHVVHVNNYKGFSLAVFSLLNELNIPTLFTAHDYSLLCMRANLIKSSGEICNHPAIACALYNRIQKYFVNEKVDILTAPSQFVLDKLMANGLFMDTRSVKIAHGVKLHGKREKKTYDTIDVLYVGQVVKAKGVHILINSIKQLRHSNVRLHILGKGRDLEYMKKLSDGDDRIKFHGFISNMDIAKFYQEANFVVVPSIWYEVFGIINIEAFSYGTPVIVSNIGGLPELVEEGNNGHMFEPGNSEELGDIIASLASNPSKLRSLEEGAFVSREKYTLVDHINKFEELYTDLLKC
jgi:glycosyltransferase involved in cell wall biosynthesis